MLCFDARKLTRGDGRVKAKRINGPPYSRRGESSTLPSMAQNTIWIPSMSRSSRVLVGAPSFVLTSVIAKSETPPHSLGCSVKYQCQHLNISYAFLRKTRLSESQLLMTFLLQGQVHPMPRKASQVSFAHIACLNLIDRHRLEALQTLSTSIFLK